MYKLDHTFSDLAKFDKFFVGADKYFAQAQRTADLLANTAKAAGYPPYNLKKTDENTYVIEMAVAGFGKQDIEMTLNDNTLIINGQVTVDTATEQFLHKGISDRAFNRTFSLADNVEVKNAKMINGLLKIWLEHIIPEDKKPKKIEIQAEDEATPSSTKKITKE
jgi:molecular chaperone IbpA